MTLLSFGKCRSCGGRVGRLGLCVACLAADAQREGPMVQTTLTGCYGEWAVPSVQETPFALDIRITIPVHQLKQLRNFLNPAEARITTAVRKPKKRKKARR